MHPVRARAPQTTTGRGHCFDKYSKIFQYHSQKIKNILKCNSAAVRGNLASKSHTKYIYRNIYIHKPLHPIPGGCDLAVDRKCAFGAGPCIHPTPGCITLYRCQILGRHKKRRFRQQLEFLKIGRNSPITTL